MVPAARPPNLMKSVVKGNTLIFGSKAKMVNDGKNNLDVLSIFTILLLLFIYQVSL